MLPNPEGPDVGNEWVEIMNGGASPVSLAGWKLRDEASHTVDLSGTIEAGARLRIELGEGQMPLNNGGDEVELVNADGERVHFVSYTGDQAGPGEQVTFGP
jgi:hypothetical protein